MRTRTADRRLHRAFTVTELLVVVGVIVVLLGLLLPALGGVWKTGEMTDSMSRMRQIALWMTTYSSDNRDLVLPSQFNYQDDAYKGMVRSIIPSTDSQFAEDWENRGTWTDILWTVNELAEGAGIVDPEYQFNSPDAEYYKKVGSWNTNPLRSSEVNLRNAPGIADPTAGPFFPRPFGSGAAASGEPGFFAANNFFNADEMSATNNGWFGQGQILYPDRSMYLVDSVAGEVIEDSCDPGDCPDGCDPWNNDPPPSQPGSTFEVDLRYGDLCLMLFLDGHVEPQGRWEFLDDLQQQDGGRSIRIQDLDKRKTPDPCPGGP